MRAVAKSRTPAVRLELRLLYIALAILATALLPGLGHEISTSITTAAANLHAS